MTLFVKGRKHYGNVINFMIFYARDADHAREIMRVNHGNNWSDTHILSGFELFQITKA